MCEDREEQALTLGNISEPGEHTLEVAERGEVEISSPWFARGFHLAKDHAEPPKPGSPPYNRRKLGAPLDAAWRGRAAQATS